MEYPINIVLDSHDHGFASLTHHPGSTNMDAYSIDNKTSITKYVIKNKVMLVKGELKLNTRPT